VSCMATALSPICSSIVDWVQISCLDKFCWDFVNPGAFAVFQLLDCGYHFLSQDVVVHVCFVLVTAPSLEIGDRPIAALLCLV